MKKSPLRIRYFRKLVFLLFTSYIIFFGILCLVEFRKAIFDPEKFSEAAHEVTVFFLVGLLSLPIAIFIAWKLTQELLRPLMEMAQTAERISGGDYSSRIVLNETYDELDQLAVSFNLAFERYETTLAKLRSFSGDAAHQLRTPLTVIQSTGETALLSSGDRDAYKKAIEQMLEELRNLKGTVNQLLQLSRLDSSDFKKTFISTNTVDVIKVTVDRFMPLAESKDIRIDCITDDHCLFPADPDLIEQVIANLLDNAIRHTPEGGCIRVALENCQIVVEDSGPGIAPEILPHVFEHFRKGNDSGQSGLGLAIVERIIHLHGGSILAENTENSGARFTIKLPSCCS